MVVDDLYVFRSHFSPGEAKPELIVDPNAVLACTIALKWLEPICGRESQVPQFFRTVKLS